jgi:LacI family transcriptional regulator
MAVKGGRVTLREVARLAGVHPGTVSRALNPETRELVNSETIRRVIQAAEELGYRPNPIARGLKTNRSYTIGVLIPDIQNPLFPPIVRGIEDRLDDDGYTALIANTENEPERERTSIEALRARQVDGFITATARSDHAMLDELVVLEIPLVLVNRRLEDRSLPSATADDRAGMLLAVRHLIDLGHRRIAHIAGPQDLSTGHARHAGFLEAMRGARLEPELVRAADAFTEAEGARICAELLDSGRPFTAIAAGNDLLALGCYDVFAERGIACPAEISVVGFNDMPFAARFNPPLTSVRIPHYEVGMVAAELLLERIQRPGAEPRELQLDPELVVRDSSGPPND